jgi:hypothetical protein
MAGGGGGGGGAAEGGARKVLARSTSFGEFVEADDDVADAGDDVEPRAAGGSGGGGGAARGFRASSAGPVPTLPSGADGAAAGGGHHAGGVARAAAMRRSATSPEGVLQRPGTALGTGGASELKALRQSKSFAGGDSGAGGLLMSPMLETVREGALTYAHAQPVRHRARRHLAKRPHMHGHDGHPTDHPPSLPSSRTRRRRGPPVVCALARGADVVARRHAPAQVGLHLQHGEFIHPERKRALSLALDCGG